jgi:hypothetical protein
MNLLRSCIIPFFLSLCVPYIQIRCQDLDSLLRNKRVYNAENIGELPLPRIDGLLDDAVWNLGEWQGDFTQQQPYAGAEGTENTYVKVLFDHSNLFVTIICQDSEPDKIRDIFDRRDGMSGDMTGIAIDSYFDKRTAFEFNLSAAGQKMDLKHRGDYIWDFNWDGVWDGATSINDTAWIAEMKIPFSQIRYADREEHTWGMHVWRWISRKHEEDQWQLIPREAPAMVYLFGELKGIRDIRTSRQVEFLPYLMGSLEKFAPAHKFEPFRYNGGINAKVGISSDYTLDLSVNPDFGQVEADPSVLNLTSFETFYEEKRPFFLEGTEIFDFEQDGAIPYYSRRIGSAPSYPASLGPWQISQVPSLTTILGSVKLTGKNRKGLSVGVVSGLTASEYAVGENGEGDTREIQVAPLSNYTAARVKREFSEGNTIVGGVFSLVERISGDSAIQALLPGEALSGGVDLLHYWNNKNYYVEAKSIVSRMQGTRDAILLKQLENTHRYQRPDAAYLGVDSTRESLSGHGGLVEVGKKGGKINFSLQGQYRSPGLDLNDMGYIREADFIGGGGALSYRMNEPGSWVRNYTLQLQQEVLWSFGGENTRNELEFRMELMNNKMWSFNLHSSYDFTHLDIRELRGGPALRESGQFQAGIHISSDASRDLWGQLGFDFRALGRPGAHQEVLDMGVTWLPVRKIRLSCNAGLDQREYYQQYVNTLQGNGSTEYIVANIEHYSTSLTFRGEIFFTPEISLQYYGSPYYSVGEYDDFRRVARAAAKEFDERLEPLDVSYDALSNKYSFLLDGETLSFGNPDFSFMQFRSNLVFRWEYKLGSTLYLVWTHERSGYESVYHPVRDITGDLFRIMGNHVVMLKLNFWFSV